MTDAGWAPNDPANDLNLQKSVLFTTVCEDIAYRLFDADQWIAAIGIELHEDEQS